MVGWYPPNTVYQTQSCRVKMAQIQSTLRSWEHQSLLFLSSGITAAKKLFYNTFKTLLNPPPPHPAANLTADSFASPLHSSTPALHWSLPGIGAGASALCHVYKFSGDTWFFITLLCRWHPAVPAVSPRWTVSLKLPLTHLCIDVGPPTPT